MRQLIQLRLNLGHNLLQKLWWVFRLLLIVWLIVTTITLVFASFQPVDAFFVLGGSIRREIYMAQVSKKNPDIPIVISGGSLDPCIWLIFHRENNTSARLWLESCAKSTFDNFYYGVPIFQKWQVHKVKLITSGSHVFRARLMAQIIFGSHGIWVEWETVPEVGIPGNQESWYKTILDVMRISLWAVISQFIQPQCLHITKLADVDMDFWQIQGFKCHYQGKLRIDN